jgi:hypothetical protein
MKSPADRTSTPIEAENQSLDDGTEEEQTDERTIECNLEDLSPEILEEVVERPAKKHRSGIAHAIVTGPINDDSGGAFTPRERAARRERRATVPSLVPSLLAKSMCASGEIPRRDPAAPTIAHGEITRPVPDGAQAVPVEQASGGYSIEVLAQGPGHEETAPGPAPRHSVAALAERACLYMKQGNIAQAILTADEAITHNDNHPEIDVNLLLNIASGPLAWIFVVGGPINRVPVIARAERELDALALDELQWAVLRRMDGRQTIDEVFATTKIPAIDALQIAASLLRAGVIRVDERAPG